VVLWNFQIAEVIYLTPTREGGKEGTKESCNTTEVPVRNKLVLACDGCNKRPSGPVGTSDKIGLQSEAKRGTNSPEEGLPLTRSVGVNTGAQGDTASVGPPIDLSHILEFPDYGGQIYLTPTREGK
jgi:hypothetical protein